MAKTAVQTNTPWFMSNYDHLGDEYDTFGFEDVNPYRRNLISPTVVASKSSGLPRTGTPDDLRGMQTDEPMVSIYGWQEMLDGVNFVITDLTKMDRDLSSHAKLWDQIIRQALQPMIRYRFATRGGGNPSGSWAYPSARTMEQRKRNKNPDPLIDTGLLKRMAPAYKRFKWQPYATDLEQKSTILTYGYWHPKRIWAPVHNFGTDWIPQRAWTIMNSGDQDKVIDVASDWVDKVITDNWEKGKRARWRAEEYMIHTQGGDQIESAEAARVMMNVIYERAVRTLSRDDIRFKGGTEASMESLFKEDGKIKSAVAKHIYEDEENQDYTKIMADKGYSALSAAESSKTGGPAIGAGEKGDEIIKTAIGRRKVKKDQEGWKETDADTFLRLNDPTHPEYVGGGE